MEDGLACSLTPSSLKISNLPLRILEDFFNFLFKKSLHISEAERHRISIHWLTLQMFATAMSRPGQCQERGTRSKLSYLSYHHCPSVCALAGSWSKKPDLGIRHDSLPGFLTTRLNCPTPFNSNHGAGSPREGEERGTEQCHNSHDATHHHTTSHHPWLCPWLKEHLSISQALLEGPS